MRINIDTRSVQLTPNRLRQRKKGAGAAFTTRPRYAQCRSFNFLRRSGSGLHES